MSPNPLICYYCISTHLGGAERSLLDLIVGMREAGGPFVPWVVVPKADGPLIDEMKRREIAFTVLPMPPGILEISRARVLKSAAKGILSSPLLALYFLRLVTLLKSRGPALIHTTGIKCHALGALAGRALGKPVVWHLRDIIPPGGTLLLLESVRQITAPKCVANSHATASSFSRSSEIKVIYNGLESSTLPASARNEFRGKLNLEPGTPVVGIVGVLARWKGQIEFLEMARLLIQKNIKAHFVVVGGEIYDTHGERGFTETLREKASALGLGSRVTFTGFIKEPAKAIGALDVLVHASIKPEPFGRVIAEGYACGVAVVASGAGGVTEIVEDGVTGLLYKPGDAGEMAAKVEMLLEDSRLRARLAASGRAYFEKRFTRERHARNMISFFESLSAAGER